MSLSISLPSVMIVGCGDIGGRLATQLLALGWRVYGLRRDVGRLPAGVIPVAGDLFTAVCPADWPQGALDYVVYSVAASTHDEAGYQAAYVDGVHRVMDWLSECGQRPKRFVFVSSTSVYGQKDGEWVDETSPTEAQSFSGQLMLKAEAAASHDGFPTTCVRLSGIYGPGRQALLNQVRQGYRVIETPPLYGNRIHADDAAGLLAFLLSCAERDEALEACYIGVDDAPEALFDVVAWLRGFLGVTEWAAEASVRRAGSKRCSNARARALGWTPRYPSYREGYAAILNGD